jgi:hypothetical protein
MKKHCSYIALLALAAFLAFLAACGGDEAENLVDSEEWNKIAIAINDLVNEDRGPIAECNKNWKEGCPTYYDDPSSSSKPNEDSSPSGGNDSSSSSKPNEDSSPSGGNDSSSDTAPPPPPPVGENCPDEEKNNILSKFTCHWDPASVKAGKNTTLKMNINDNNCTAGKASRLIGTGFKKGYAYFTVDTPVQASGVYKDMDKDGEALTNPVDKEWPKSGDFIVHGSLICGAYNCSKECSPLNIIEAGKPIVSGLKFSCPWTPLPVGTNNLSKGSTTAECELEGTIANNLEDELGCENNGILTKNNIRYCNGNIGGSPADCNNKTGEIKIEAVAKCQGGNSTVQTLTYNIVPDPSVSGTCAWDTKNNTFGGGVTAKVTSASTATINDSYGRCDAAPSFFVNNTKRTLVSAGLAVDAWDGTTTQTMTDITIGVACGATNANTITCPAITVKDPNAMCEYQTSWCEGIALNKIKTADVTSDPGVGQSGENPGACFFATTVDKIGNVTEAQFKVNGVEGTTVGKCGNTGWGQPTCATALASIDKADNGYYIYVSNAAWTAQDLRLSNSYKPQLHPNCEAQK